MKNVITVQDDDGNLRAFTNIKKVCKIFDLGYHTYKSKSFPFTFLTNNGKQLLTVHKTEVERD